MHFKELGSRLSTKPAIIYPDKNTSISFADFGDMTAQVANYVLAKFGTEFSIAVSQNNDIDYLVALCACVQSPFHLVSINNRLTDSEKQDIVEDSKSKCILSVEDYESAYNTASKEPITTELFGTAVFYSSGTTGKPKGIIRPLLNIPVGVNGSPYYMARRDFNINEESVFYSPGPYYHAASGGTTVSALSAGATVINTEKFDAEKTLEYIEKYKITHMMMVPTHLIRILKLPESVRNKYDLSSLELIVHGAAPCPIEVKQKMIEWVGPIIFEYYATSEVIGYTNITSAEWLLHKGSVGKSLIGNAYVVDHNGIELPRGEIGYLVFDAPLSFNYSNAEGNNSLLVFGDKIGVGDIGWMDREDYIYLTDRHTNMIVSGGVNIYPQEAENILIMHPAVKDVAVIGVPNRDMGEEVKAIVELQDSYTPSEDLSEELIGYIKTHIASFKCPKSIDFTNLLPRSDSGKLLKKEIKEKYWGNDRNQIIRHTVF